MLDLYSAFPRDAIERSHKQHAASRVVQRTRGLENRSALPSSDYDAASLESDKEVMENCKELRRMECPDRSGWAMYAPYKEMSPNDLKERIRDVGNESMRSVRVAPKEPQRRQYHNMPPPSGQLNDRGRIPEWMEPHVVVKRIGGRDGGTLYAGRDDDSSASKTLDANETTTSADGYRPHAVCSEGTNKYGMQSCNPLTSSPGNGLIPDWRFLGHSRYTRPATDESQRDLIFPGRVHGGGRDNSNKPKQNNSSTWTPVTR